MNDLLSTHRLLQWRVLIVLVVLLVAFPIVVFSSHLHAWLRPAARASGGLINADLQIYLVEFLLLWVIVCRWGGLGRQELGLDVSKLTTGAALALGVWVANNLVQVSIHLANRAPISLHPDWARLGVTVVLGALLAQLFGNALFEEIVYRHLIVSQLNARFRWPRSPTVRLLVVVLAVQFLFAMIHIPHRLWHGIAPSEVSKHILDLTIAGLMYAWGYLQTRNLFFVVGWHALSNEPTLLIQQAHNPHEVLQGIVMCALFVQLIVLASQTWTRQKRRLSNPIG